MSGSRFVSTYFLFEWASFEWGQLYWWCPDDSYHRQIGGRCWRITAQDARKHEFLDCSLQKFWLMRWFHSGTFRKLSWSCTFKVRCELPRFQTQRHHEVLRQIPYYASSSYWSFMQDSFFSCWPFLSRRWRPCCLRSGPFNYWFSSEVLNDNPSIAHYIELYREESSACFGWSSWSFWIIWLWSES